MSKEEYLTIRSLHKGADKGSPVVVWDRSNYLKEANGATESLKTYKEIIITQKDHVELVGKSNIKLFLNLRTKTVITERMKTTILGSILKKVTNLGKLYLLPKIHKDLCKVTGQPVIYKYGTPTEKVSEFLDHHLDRIMKQGENHKKDTGNFSAKLNAAGEFLKESIFVTAGIIPVTQIVKV